MREDEREFGEAASLRAGLVEYLLLGVLEQPHRLLALVHEVLHEDTEELVLVEERHVLLVVLEHDAQMLVRVGQDVQDERRAVLEVQSPVGALVHNLVHHLPCFLDRLLVDGSLGFLLCVDTVRDSLQPGSRLASHLGVFSTHSGLSPYSLRSLFSGRRRRQ